MVEEFDVHANRHRMKQLRDTGDTGLYDNRDGVECPACGRAFDTLYVTENRTASFDPDEPFPICLLREEGRLLVFTH